MDVAKDVLLDMYKVMLKIRLFDERVSELFAQGKLAGFVHCYVGEEAIPAGVCANLKENDCITSTHRGHGHLIAKGGITKYMMAELYGKETGYCKGKGGSMHIADTSKGILGANGIVGAGIPIAVGAGISFKMQKLPHVSASFFGDGASNRGSFHEGLNLASIWDLPVVFICENNMYGEFTRQGLHQRITNIASRAAAYGFDGITIDGNDAVLVYETAYDAINKARNGGGPTLIECKTYRLKGHFEGDPGSYRTKDEIDEWKKKDPIIMLEDYLKGNNIADDIFFNNVKDEMKKEIEEAQKFAEESNYPSKEQVVEDVYSDIIEKVER